VPSPRRSFARREVAGISLLLGTVLLLVSGRYGYHRDELYFLAAGRHLAWGYPDQPPLVPLIARLMSDLAPHSLVVLRLPATLAAAGIVFLTGLIARDLGAQRGGQVLAAGAMASATVLQAAGHLLSTTTIDLLGWTLLTWLLLRVRSTPHWLLIGVVAGLTLMANTLMAFLLAAVLLGLLLWGPRSRGPLLAGLVAALMWSPYLLWQARHGWPQLDVADHIAHGGSGTSSSRWLLLPFQVVLVSPWLAPVWIAGLVRLLRDRQLRFLGAAYPVLLVVFGVAGGKPYYVAGLFPLLLAAGAQPTLAWVRNRFLLPAAFVLSAPGLLITLPVLPASAHVAANYDAGETIGWPEYVDQIASAYRQLPPGTAILTANYGEAGAVDRYGPALGLPHACSGHNGYWYWGPPPSAATQVLAVGLTPADLTPYFQDVRLVGRLTNSQDIKNDEYDEPLTVAAGLRAPWATTWPRLKHLG
jgi:hypothetical protein